MVGTIPTRAGDSLVPADTEDPAAYSRITEVSIPGPIRDVDPHRRLPNTPSEPDFKVIESRTSPIRVVEPPPMHGLPPVKGTVNVTINRVEPPMIPPLPLPLPDAAPPDPAVLAAIEEFRRNYKGTELLLISATVFDRSRTYLRIHPHGASRQAITAWSNIDFNHFSGFSTFRVTREDGSFTDLGMLMGLANRTTQDAESLRERLRKQGREDVIPELTETLELPVLAAAGPQYVIVEGGGMENPAREILAFLHRLYATEGPRMAAACLERERVREEREAYYRANPPSPKDVSIHFWRTDSKEDSR